MCQSIEGRGRICERKIEGAKEDESGSERNGNRLRAFILNLSRTRHVPDLYWLQLHLGDAPRSLAFKLNKFELWFIIAMHRQSENSF